MINRDNYHATRAYGRYMLEVLQRDVQTATWFHARIAHVLRWLDASPLAVAPIVRPTLPEYLTRLRLPAEWPSGRRAGEPYGARSIAAVLMTARSMFEWLARDRPKVYYLVTPAWLDTLVVPRRAGAPPKPRRVVTLEMVEQLIELPHDGQADLATWRDQAAAAMLFLSGMRARAFATLPIQCVDLEAGTVAQLPSMGVETKLLKSATTALLPIPRLLAFVRLWDERVRRELPATSPWYALIHSRASHAEPTLVPDKPGSSRRTALADNLKMLFRRASLEPMNVHAFRHGHATYALSHAATVEDLKAISQNLMHASLAQTDQVYAILSDQRVAERIRSLGQQQARPAVDLALVAAIAEEVARKLREQR